MMKQLLFISFLLIGITSYQQQPSSFTIRGKFKDIPLQTIYLEHRTFHGLSIVLDSIQTLADGSYKFKVEAKEPGLYLIRPKKGSAAIFTNDSKEIIINLSNSNHRFPEIIGSLGTKSIYRFLAPIDKENALYESIDKQLDSLQLLGNVDSLVNALQAERQKILDERVAFAKSLVQSSKSPAAIFYIITQMSVSAGKSVVIPWLVDARKRFKEHEGLQALYTSLTMENEQKVVIYALQGAQAPDLVMPGIDGKLISINSFKGKYLLLDFWASWCGPCREENPNLVATYNKYKDKNFTILSVSLDKEKVRWLRAIEKDGLSWLHMSDLKFWDSEAVAKYHIGALPFNVLIDPSGKIIASSLRGEELEKKLSEVLLKL